MKEELGDIDLIEKEFFIEKNRKAACILNVWHDNNLSEAYQDDTIGIAVKKCFLTENDKPAEEDDIEFNAVWLTKAQCIILKNYLDSFIQLAETETELDMEKI